MNIILTYLLNMLLYMILALPVYALIRFSYIQFKQLSVQPIREALLLFFVVFLVGLASQTIIPKLEIDLNGIHIVQTGVHRTNLTLFKVISQTYREVIYNGNVHYFFINFLGNIILFIPLGFMVLLLWNLKPIHAILIGFSTSLLIETCQLFLARGTDVDDLILNTLGTSIGVFLYQLLRKRSIF